MLNTFSIFDFDQTVTKEHTFATKQLAWFEPDHIPITLYNLGKKDALKNKKVGVTNFFKHDDEHLSAIATYHDNPMFIAGFIAALLGKELSFIKTIYSETHPITAINFYTVEGMDTPFLISYIPVSGDAFKATLSSLNGKKDQVLFLRNTLLDEKLMSDNAIINFYDDRPLNFESVKSIPLINSYLVSDSNDTFSITDISLCTLPVPKIPENNLIELPIPQPIQPLPEKDTPLEEVNSAKPISASFFMQLMGSPLPAIVGGLLLIAGLAALSVGLLGASVAVIATTTIGALMVAGGTGLIAHSIFSPKIKPVTEHIDEKKLHASL